MKKVLMVFLGLVLLTQAVRLWERGHVTACVKRNVPAGTHHSHPGGGLSVGPTIMIA
jgi:hypothetical protein